MEDTLISLFCIVDDFCIHFLPEWNKHLLTDGLKKRNRPSQLSPSEIMTIYIHFHQSHYRDFKNYYTYHVQVHLKKLFPKLVSYPRFISLIKSVIIPLCFFITSSLNFFCSSFVIALYFLRNASYSGKTFSTGP